MSPKFTLGSFVTLKFLKLDSTTIKDAPNVHRQKSSMLAGSGCAHSAKNKNGHVTGNNIVQLDAQRPPRQLHTLLEKAEHLLTANVVGRITDFDQANAIGFPCPECQAQVGMSPRLNAS